MITHIVSDWLFSPCCVEHQDEFIFERVAVAYSRDYNEVGRAQIKLALPLWKWDGPSVAFLSRSYNGSFSICGFHIY